MDVVRWFFLTAPARAYKRGEANGGSVPWLHFVALAVGAVLGGLVGVCVGWVHGDAQGGIGVGIAVGLLLAVAWFIYGLALVGVMRFRGKPLETLVGPGWSKRPRRWYER